jgi:Clp amino terminal domain, pathogenicity island component/NTF2 fold immunity protein
MFERYTERARRVIFFGRQEASNFGSRMIETEHLLLGLLHEDSNLVARFQREAWAGASIREELKKRSATMENVPMSVDMPLSPECRRILAYAAEEAERLMHNHIGTEHLLLGMLREEKCVAAQILIERGLNLFAIRAELASSPQPIEPPTGPFAGVVFRRADMPPPPESGIVPDADTAKHIAEVIWTPLYGSETVAGQSPLKADLRDNVWIVTGSSPPNNALFAFILKTDGRILSVGRGPVKL